MEDKPLVTVVVPVYNVKDYLQECLESILNQTYTNLEIIVVDDGSTDGSSEICDDISKTDMRLKIIHQSNSGVAATRKKAILKASGIYICFVDSDDKIDGKMIESFVGQIGDCDIITSGCYCENEAGEYSIRMDAFEDKCYDTKKALEYLVSNMIVFHDSFDDGILPFLWNKMYKAEIVKEAVLDVDTSIACCEDRDLLYRCLLIAKGVRVTHKCYYYYRYRGDSTMKSANSTYMCDLNRLYLTLYKAFEVHPQGENLIHQLQLFIALHTHVITWYMGFPPETQSGVYVFPFTDLGKDSKVILYGAGKVGKDYYRQIHRKQLLQIVLWVDRKWERHSANYAPVTSPDGIGNCEFDYIIIAVKSIELAETIRAELLERGISGEKILWRMPMMLTL